MKRIGDVAMDRITTIRRAAALQRLSLLADFCQVLLSLTKPEGERGEQQHCSILHWVRGIRQIREQVIATQPATLR